MTEKPPARRWPVRKCLACQGRGEKRRLWRFVWGCLERDAAAVKDAATEEPRLHWDKQQRLPGRGVYLHSSLSCLLRASESRQGEGRQWARALRLESGHFKVEGLKLALEQARAALPLEEQPQRQKGSQRHPGKVRL